MKKNICVVLLLLGSVLSAQDTVTNIDSLLTVLANAKPDTTKVNLYKTIASHFNVTHLDSAKTYAMDGISLARKLKHRYGEMMNLSILGNYYERKTQYDSAMTVYSEARDIAGELNSDKGFAVILNNIATIHIRKGEYKIALQLMFDALKAEEKLENKNGISQAYNNIGIIYYYMLNMEKATEYLTKSLEIQEELGNYSGLINGYNNVGAIYDYIKQYKKAIASYEKGLAISKKIKDKKQEATQLNNIALVYTTLKDFDKAEKVFEQSLQLREEVKDYNGMCQTLITYGELWLDKKNPDRAESYLMKGKALAEKYDLRQKKIEAYFALSKWYVLKEDYDAFEKYVTLSTAVKDSIINDEHSSALAEMETKYDTEKKENEILRQRTQIAEGDLKIKQKNTMIYGIGGLAILLALLGYLLYNQQRLKNRQQQKENELKTALASIETQNKLQEQRLRISRDLHDNIGSQLTFIISSLDTLKYRLKDADDSVRNKLTDIGTFTKTTINELRDTIWAMNKSSITFEDLQGRISNFIDTAQKAVGHTRFEFSMDPDIPSGYAFTAVEGIHLYRIIQEAVNNALKYASAEEIGVSIQQSDERFTIRIKDNGKGFDTAVPDLGNGLANMKRRMKDVGGDLEIKSQIGVGTEIIFHIPVS